jgi:hypothetical protein
MIAERRADARGSMHGFISQGYLNTATTCLRAVVRLHWYIKTADDAFIVKRLVRCRLSYSANPTCVERRAGITQHHHWADNGAIRTIRASPPGGSL